MTLTFTIPAKTTNPQNGSQGRTRGGQIARAKERKRLRELAALALKCAVGRGSPPALPLVVTLTRVAPSGGLDPHDGLRAALKPVVDGLADALGLADDRDPRVTWRYAQRRAAVLRDRDRGPSRPRCPPDRHRASAALTLEHDARNKHENKAVAKIDRLLLTT